MGCKPLVLLSALVGMLSFTLVSRAAEVQPRRPDRFAIIFNAGYAGDHLPQDEGSFEKLILAVKAAHFNVVLGKYEEWRAKICRKHGLQMMVDLLAPDHHVYKNVDAARKLCEGLRGSDVVYGYHIWSDNIGETYPGRSRDVKNVHEWDDTHPVYVGSYRMSRVNRVEGLDLLGYYDFHWKRGGHWGHLAKASSVASGKDALFLRYCDAAPGRIGIGNANRVGFTIATSIPFGLKGYMFHYGGGVVEKDTGELDALGKDLQTVNANFKPLESELIKIGNPRAVYSTPVTKTEKDRPTGTEPAVPAGLTGAPDDLWFRVTAGEVVFGLFTDGEKRDVLAIAGHNAYQPQKVTLQFSADVKAVAIFDRTKRQWESIDVVDEKVSFDVAVFATELVRVER